MLHLVTYKDIFAAFNIESTVFLNQIIIISMLSQIKTS